MGYPPADASDRPSHEKRATRGWVALGVAGATRRSAVVSRLAVRRDVEPFALVLLGDAQADRHVDDLVGDQRDDAGPDDGDDHRLELDPDLVEDADGADRRGHPVGDLPRAAQHLRVEDAGEQRADDAADTMHAE